MSERAELSLLGYHRALYRFMAVVATDERWGTTNAEYARLLATGMPPAVVNSLCPFDATQVSLLWRGVVTALPWGWRARRMLRRQVDELVVAAEAVEGYLLPAPLALLANKAGDRASRDMAQIMGQWWQVRHTAPLLWHGLTIPVSNLLGGAHLLAQAPQTLAPISEVDESGDAPLLAEFDWVLTRFMLALKPLVP